MIYDQNQLDGLCSLLEEEITSYTSVLDDLKQEWEFLKTNDTSSLISLLQIKGNHISRIQELRKSVDQAFTELAIHWVEPNFPKTVFDLAPHVPVSQAKRIIHYQGTISRLKQKIHQLNEQNKRFIQENLDFIRGLFSLITCPAQEETYYVKGGKKESAPRASSWVSRKV
jgi:flagellar biosynthesis/type III secretory pathway chaperone